MRYEKVLMLSREEAKRINKYCYQEPTCEEECLGEDETIVNTVQFDNGIEMLIKCCGVQYEDGDNNCAWTEAVLFKGVMQVAYTDVSDGYFGEWSLEYDGDEYVVLVEENELRELSENEVTTYLCNRAALHNQLSELQADLEDLSDEDLLECRQCMLDRINECLSLILETDEDNEIKNERGE